MIRPETWEAKTLDWVAEKVYGIILFNAKKHVRESEIYRLLAPMHHMVEYGDKSWRPQCPGFYALGRGDRLRIIRRAIKRLRDCGKLIVVNRFPMRDPVLLGPGKEELVFGLGGVLDELAGALSS